MSYSFTPAIWPPLAVALLAAAVGLQSWRRRDMPGARQLAAACLFVAFWMAGIILETLAVEPAAKVTGYRFQSIWPSFALLAAVCFVLEYTYPGRWLSRRNVALLAAPLLVPLLDLLLTAIDNRGFVWYSLEVEAGGQVTPYLAPAGRFIVGYMLILLGIQVTALVWLFVRSPRHRWPAALMLVAGIVSRSAYMLDYFRTPLPVWFDFRLVGPAVALVAYTIALFGFRIFDPLPVARATVIEQMRAGMIVFDPRWQIAGLNPAAEQILGIPFDLARGKTWEQMSDPERLPPLPHPNLGSGDAEFELPEMVFGTGANVRYYEPALTVLRDFRGLLVGHLLTLRETTQQKRAQARILEQERALAVLREREQLARELHDSTGQTLAFVSLQAQAIAKHVQDGDLSTAEAQLRRLAQAAQQANADVRESILILKGTPTEQWSFLSALQQYLVTYGQYSQMATRLDIQPGLDAGAISPASSVQLFRVVQEALTNAHKHSHAACVTVSVAQVDGENVISISDDGVGFDPPPGTAGRDGHYGLGFMVERMAEIGGRLAVDSQPGAGTRVVLRAPVRGA